MSSMWTRLLNAFTTERPGETAYLLAEAELLQEQTRLLKAQAVLNEQLAARRRERIKRSDQRRQAKIDKEKRLEESFRPVAWSKKYDGEHHCSNGHGGTKIVQASYIVYLLENKSKTKRFRRLIFKKFSKETGAELPFINNTETDIPGFIRSTDEFNRWYKPWHNWMLTTDDIRKCEELNFPGETE